ncbi:MAG: hypothetical protein ACPHID_01655 [Thermoplasmatota archaeon]
MTAVTNPVQRQILEALGQNDLQLPDLVELTGKAKSTLSSIHVRELLRRELVEELPHPSDSRRKIYRLVGRPMKASESGRMPEMRSLPTRPAPTGGINLATVFQVLAAAPLEAHTVMDQQARALGARYASRLASTDATGFAHALTRFVEEERLAQHLQLDFEGMAFRCLPGPAVSQVDAARMGVLLAAFATGAAQATGLADVVLTSSVEGDAFLLAPNRS